MKTKNYCLTILKFVMTNLLLLLQSAKKKKNVVSSQLFMLNYLETLYLGPFAKAKSHPIFR